ncbi:MAG: L,D-transpeptidase [Alphaproteobacteria bacterium]|nr:L,D-transpeptidase [Alphaproteobacteria bacterium]
MRARVTISAAAAAFLLAGPLAAEPVADTGKSNPSIEVAAATSGTGAETGTPAKAEAEPKAAAVAPAAPEAKPKPAAPSLRVSISLTSQTMSVIEHGQTTHVWKISSGRSGYHTPTGNYRPQWMTRMHYSKKYDNAPMPHSVFFHGGYAIHATYATGALGSPASHGCIRLSPANAKTFYGLVGKHGKARTRIAVTGSTPARVYAKRKTTHRKSYAASGTNSWNNGYWQPSNPKPVTAYKAHRKKAAQPSYSYSYYKPKYKWPGDN